jgi:acyl-CoA thioester hydrolase
MREDGAGPWFTYRLTVRFFDTDAQRIVHHANYLVYLEEARSEFVRSRGIPYREIDARGIAIVLAKAEMRCTAPATFDDELVVRMRPAVVGSRLATFEYRIEHAVSGRLLVEARTTHAFVDRMMKAVRAPDWLREALEL